MPATEELFVLLTQLFYVSRAANAYDNDAVKDILAISRRNNQRDDITGCLLFSGTCFAQVLEGRPAVVDAKLKRIAADTRHVDFRLLVERPITLREYGDWSMGYLHDLDLEDSLEAFLANPEIVLERAVGVMNRMKPDTVMGALA